MITELQTEMWAEHARFAGLHYGQGAYQASSNYLHWLYGGALRVVQPLPALVSLGPDGQIEGVIHRMALPTAYRDSPVVVLHNLMVAPESRNGTGFLLLKRSLRGAGLVVVPGVSGEFAGVYPLMRAQQIPTYWLRKKASVAGIGRAVLHSVGGAFALKDFLQGLNGQTVRGCKATTIASSDALRELADALVQKGSGGVMWTEESLRWRLFHRYGPACAIVSDGGSFGVLSFGWVVKGRYAVPVARLLDVVGEASGAKRGTTEASLALAAEVGAYEVMATTSDIDQYRFLESCGFVHYKESPKTYWIPRRPERFKDYVFSGLATDLGFEGISHSRIALLPTRGG